MFFKIMVFFVREWVVWVLYLKGGCLVLVLKVKYVCVFLSLCWFMCLFGFKMLVFVNNLFFGLVGCF